MIICDNLKHKSNKEADKKIIFENFDITLDVCQECCFEVYEKITGKKPTFAE